MLLLCWCDSLGVRGAEITGEGRPKFGRSGEVQKKCISRVCFDYGRQMSSFEKTLSILEDIKMMQLFVWRFIGSEKNGPAGNKYRGESMCGRVGSSTVPASSRHARRMGWRHRYIILQPPTAAVEHSRPLWARHTADRGLTETTDLIIVVKMFCIKLI